MEGPVNDLPQRVTIREVGPRDGLQAERPLPVDARARLIDALSETGELKIEAVSFVSPKAVPAMADPASVWGRVHRSPRVHYSALVPNSRGAEAAVEAGGFASLQAFLAASDAYNLKNVAKTVWESVIDVAEVVAVGRESGLPVECSVSTAFGDPYEGDVSPSRVLEVARELLEVGVAAISLADTTGMATPTRVWDLVGMLRDRLPGVRLNLHFHDTRGTAMANVLAALQMGVSEFDASVGGLGGSPFAPGANGNVATEDLVHMLTDMGIETRIDFAKLTEAAHLAEELVGHLLAGQVSKVGPRWAAGRPDPKT
jgi:hydroxymethylglutaryl-CoA lyase